MDLRTALRTRASVDGPIVKVDGFLNHRVDPSVMSDVGRRLAAALAPLGADVLLTAEASGIPPAAAAASELGLPYVYAKKYVGPGTRYTFAREVSSPTKGTEYRVEVARHALEPGLRIAVIDDFLAGGRTAVALCEIAEEAGCTVVGTLFVIEKAFAGGRLLIESRGWTVTSLERITSLDGGIVHLA
ncbi:MAG: phosphoribosyltransferase family protein [Acidimicrobiia bacterium]|nr:phosphoribosyltransferase family protein [Acidimicrobiia bacterium]